MADESLADLAETMKDIEGRADLAERRRPDAGFVKSTVRAGALTLAALAGLSVIGSGVLASATPASAAPAAQRIGGTWDLSWRNSRGEIRKGSMSVEQRGSQLMATVYDRGGATATGSISGSSFTLQGRRIGLPFAVTGRVKGRKMAGTLTALGIERNFTGTRRGR